MTHGFSSSSTNYQIDKYFADRSISDAAKDKLKKDDVLILPHLHGDDKYYFSQEAIDFAKFCKQADADVKSDILADYDKIEVRELRSFDIWMPIIWVASNVILPTVLGIVANYISARTMGREHENCKVVVDFIIKSGDTTKELHFDGDAKSFKEAFKKIDLAKL